MRKLIQAIPIRFYDLLVNCNEKCQKPKTKNQKPNGHKDFQNHDGNTTPHTKLNLLNFRNPSVIIDFIHLRSESMKMFFADISRIAFSTFPQVCC